MKYQVNQYLIYSINEHEAVIQTQHSTFVVKNEAMINLLFSLENKSYIEDEELNFRFGGMVEAAIAYLEKNNLLTAHVTKNFNINRIVFISTGEWNRSILPKYIESIEVIYSNIDDLEASLNSGTLVVSNLNPYHVNSVDTIRKIISSSRYSDSIYEMHSFIYGTSIYVDNFYNQLWAVPDHRDHLGIIQSSHDIGETNVSYVDVLNYIYDNDPFFNVARPLAEDEQIFILNFLVNRIHLLLSLYADDMLRDYELLKTFELKLNERRVYADTATFWELSANE